MTAPKALILAGYGLNCEEETATAFAHNGATTEIIHINDLIAAPEKLNNAQILAVPGGFSYGDDTGSGAAFANKIRNRLLDALAAFTARNTLTIGICNGCQILSRLHLVPGLDLAQKGIEVGVLYNASNRYQCRWVDVATADTSSPWLTGITRMHIPVAHGEGNMVMSNEALAHLRQNRQIALTYITPEGAPANGAFPANPNGSTADIAGLTDASGRVLALMPHPERGMFFTQREDWPLLKETYRRQGKPLPTESDGMAIFRNAVRYFA